jgi:hypothetical protein
MGDRANFGFKQMGGTVFLYAHWGGYQMMNTLANAIKVVMDNGREDDPVYATRIAISHIIGDEWASPYGYGISVNTITDNEHSIPIVDWTQGNVSLYTQGLDTIKFTMPLGVFVQKFLKEVDAKPLTYTRV